jgi:hypothetical protein
MYIHHAEEYNARQIGLVSPALGHPLLHVLVMFYATLCRKHSPQCEIPYLAMTS